MLIGMAEGSSEVQVIFYHQTYFFEMVLEIFIENSTISERNDMDSKKIFRTFDVDMALLRYRDNLMQGICGTIRNFWKFVLVSGWKVFIFELSKIRYCMERLSFGTTPHVSTSDLYQSCPTRKVKV